jgi:hypothetical protein
MDFPTPAVRWIRNLGANEAERTDGFIVKLRGSQWTVMKNGKTKVLPTEPFPAYLDRAIHVVDQHFPPPKWRFDENRWISGNWVITEAGEAKWKVQRLDVHGLTSNPTRQEFLSPDRARVWVELRRERANMGLRGPKPRAGSPAKAKLPDIRVTIAERDAATLILGRLGMSYSGFVRAALEWADEHVGVNWTVDHDSEGEPYFTPLQTDGDSVGGQGAGNDETPLDGGAWDDLA